MDPKRFDALVQSLAAAGSRRRLFGAVLAGALPPLAAAASARRRHRPGRGHARTGAHAAAPDRADVAGTADATPGDAPAAGGPRPAKCLAQGKRCTLKNAAGQRGKKKKGKQGVPSCAKCCSRFGAAGSDGKARCSCKPEGAPCDDPSACCGGQCRDGACTGCSGDLTACAGQCVDLQTANAHCGDCATACAVGQRCRNGSCVCDSASCPNGCCDGTTCQRGTSDDACGDGGAGCQTCATCTTCDGTSCVNAVACCGDAAVCANGQCVDCTSGQRCQRGQCGCDGTSCPHGCCDGAACVPFAQQTDNRCGTGGAACAACTGHDTCGGGGTDGVCGCTPTTCADQGKTCGPIDDGCGETLDCGACDLSECLVCGAAGACVRADDNTVCGNGNRCCGGVCIDVDFDGSNCGSCGHTCPRENGNVICESGACCQETLGEVGTCGMTLPCCGGTTCNNDGHCCIPSGGPICHTLASELCCSGVCVPDDPHCTGNCDGHCQPPPARSRRRPAPAPTPIGGRR